MKRCGLRSKRVTIHVSFDKTKMVKNAIVEKGQFGWFSNIVSPHSVWKSPKILPFTRYVVKWYFSGHFQKLCSCLHAKLIFQTFRLLKVASFLMQRKQLCSSSVFPSSLLNGRLRRRRRRHACPYRVEKANFYGSATGIKLCVCWEKNGMEMLRQKIQLMPLLWNVLEGGAPLSFILFQINLPDFQCFFCFFCVSYWEMYWSYLENREREW